MNDSIEGPSSSPENGSGNERLKSAERTIDQRFWDLLLPQLFGIIILLSLVAGCSIFRQIRVQQHSAEYIATCAQGATLRIIYPRTVPVRFDDTRGLPLTLSMSSIDAPQTIALKTSPPLELRTTTGRPLSDPLRLTPKEPMATVFLWHEPVGRAVARAAIYDVWVEPPVSMGCHAPSSNWRDWTALVGSGGPSGRVPGDPLLIEIAAQDQTRGYFYELVAFLSNPEVWGGLVVGLVGGGLSLQLARQERRERRKQRREREERERREAEYQRRVRQERAQQAKQLREEKKREAVAQEIVAIRRELNENVEQGIIAFNHLAKELAGDRAFDEDLAALHAEVFSSRSFMVLLRRANEACRTEEPERLQRTLRQVVQGFDPASLTPLQAHLYTVAACNLDGTAVNPIGGADSLLELWDGEQYEYYELIVRGLQQLWQSAKEAGDETLERHLRARLAEGTRLRDILRDTRLRALPTAADFGSPLPKFPRDDRRLGRGDPSSMPYLSLLDSRHVAAISLPRDPQRLMQPSAMLIGVEHPYDKPLLAHILHRESRLLWPIVASYVPEPGSLLSQPAFLARLCRALADAWITLLKTVPTADLLMGDTAPLLSSLLMWCYGGTTSGVAHALATARPIVERGRGLAQRQSSERAERLLVERLVSRVAPTPLDPLVESTLQHWLTVTPYGYRRNLFILVDEGVSEQEGACWIDDRELASLAKRGCILKFITERPGYYRVARPSSVLQARWDQEDIQRALETAQTYPLAREIFTPAESRRWQDAFQGASVESVIAGQAGASLGQAISLGNLLVADTQNGAGRLTVEAVRNKLG